MKIKELFSDPSKWTQQFYARNSHGLPAVSGHKDAVCWCLKGAVKRCYETAERQSILDKISAKIGPEIAGWNDHVDRKFEDVKQLVEELDI